jgi:hypothetical protein
VKIYDNSYCYFEDTDMGDRLQVNRYSSNNSRFSGNSNCNKSAGLKHILKRSVPIIRETYNIGEDGTTGVSKLLQFFQCAAYFMTVTQFPFHLNSTWLYFTHYYPVHSQLHMYLRIGII